MVVKRNMHELAMDALLEAITEGTYADSGRLPPVAELAKLEEISRDSMLEAQHALKARGVLEVKHGVTAKIEPFERWHALDPDVLRALLAGPERERTLVEVAECRATIWPRIAELAAERRTEADLRALAAALNCGPDAYLAALRDAAGNRFLRQVASTLEDAVAAAAGTSASGPSDTGDSDAPAGGLPADAAVLPALDHAVRAGSPRGSRAAMEAYLG